MADRWSWSVENIINGLKCVIRQISSKISSIINKKNISKKDENKSTVLNLISRDMWSARPARRVEKMTSTARSYSTAHTDTPECRTLADCKRTVKRLQNVHIDLMELDDIGYNFLVGGDGNVYEGRGWKTVCNCTIPSSQDANEVRAEEIRNQNDSTNLTIAYIGNKESEDMKNALADLIYFGRVSNHIDVLEPITENAKEDSD